MHWVSDAFDVEPFRDPRSVPLNIVTKIDQATSMLCRQLPQPLKPAGQLVPSIHVQEVYLTSSRQNFELSPIDSK
jgi:hypothetical protein